MLRHCAILLQAFAVAAFALVSSTNENGSPHLAGKWSVSKAKPAISATRNERVMPVALDHAAGVSPNTRAKIVSTCFR